MGFNSVFKGLSVPVEEVHQEFWCEREGGINADGAKMQWRYFVSTVMELSLP